VYILVTKRANASTLAVVNEVKKNLPAMQAALHDVPDIKVSFEFEGALRRVMRLRWFLVADYVVVAGLLIWLVGGHLATDIFPRFDGLGWPPRARSLRPGQLPRHQFLFVEGGPHPVIRRSSREP
jgi:hypothetical protein